MLVLQMTPLRDTTDKAGVSQSPQPGASHPDNSLLDLFYEDDRLETYDTWLVPYINKQELAAAGFYFTGVDDIVKCPYCKLEVGKWSPNDVPEAEHRKYSGPSKCLYLLWKQSLKPDETRPTDEEQVYDTTGPQGLEGVKLTLLMYDKLKRAPLLAESYHNSTYVSVNEAYLHYNNRLKTFENWPETAAKISPEALSDSGFFYSNIQDGTTCFHCGGNLRGWKETDDPWIEHAGRFPDCKYVLIRKGQKFIDKARMKVQPQPEEEESKE